MPSERKTKRTAAANSKRKKERDYKIKVTTMNGWDNEHDVPR